MANFDRKLGDILECDCYPVSVLVKINCLVKINSLLAIIYRAGSRIFRGGAAWTYFGGFWPPTWALFSENGCENKRIGSCRGRTPAHPLDPPMIYSRCYTRVLSNTSLNTHAVLRYHNPSRVYSVYELI